MKSGEKKTALVLSGGGSRGAYEAGAWQALTELGIRIDIVTGTSVGAINGAMVVQGDLDNTVRLWKEIETHMIFDVPEGTQPREYAREIVFNKGAGTSGLKKLLEKYIDEETVRKAPADFGVVIVELPTFTPHYVYKEEMKPGQLLDYILASASLYPAIHSCEIDGKEYIDGGYADVMPVQMALDKGADEVIAVYLNAVGIVDRKALQATPNLTLIESRWDLGSTLIFDTDNARRIMRLGYLDAMKAYHVFDGEYYTFARGSFDKATLKMADAAAHVFELDPCLIYTKERFLQALGQAIEGCGEDLEEAMKKYQSSDLPLTATVELLKEIHTMGNKKMLAFLAARNLSEKGADSIFLTRAAMRLMPECILAGRFLSKYHL
ncbi:MAG: patatin-like phospholipase family protein [Anaerovoracaceae bacterium]|nr:patatin-like phospholipase family protein [Anaerovoracaceae bacterium]